MAAADLLPTAEGSGPAKVTVELVEGGDDEARKKKEEEADAKRCVTSALTVCCLCVSSADFVLLPCARQQNALPSWIEKSTLTGELTAAGAAQHAKTGASVSISHDDDTVTSPKKAAAAADDDVDDYYAALAASHANNGSSAIASTSYGSTRKEDDAASAHHGSPASNGKLVDSGYEEFGDEIDAGRNGSYSYSPTPASPTAALNTSTHLNNSHRSASNSLGDSLRPPSAASMTNSLGKRSREASEESEGGKKVRTGDSTPFASAPTPPVSTALHNDILDGGLNGEEEEEVEDPILTVAGKEVRFSAITEDMTSEMTAEEYTLWWETLSALE